MKNKKRSDYSLLFDNEKAMSKDELNLTKGGSACNNFPVFAGPVFMGWAYIGLG